jgi:hypothetical protein
VIKCNLDIWIPPFVHAIMTMAATPNHPSDLDIDKKASYCYGIDEIRKQFPALRQKTTPLNNANGSLGYQGVINSQVGNRV